MKEMNVKKVIIHEIDSKNTTEALGNIQLSLISSLFSLSHEVTHDVFIEVMKKVGALNCAFQNAIFLAIMGSDDYKKLRTGLLTSINEFFDIHDEAHARSVKLNQEMKEKLHGKMN